MAEELDLTTPIVESTTTDIFRVVSLMLNSEMLGMAAPFPLPPPGTPLPPIITDPGVVQIALKDNNGVTTTYSYYGLLAQDMIKFINTGNFSTRSLHKRILEKLNADGKLVGAVVGTPEVPASDTGLE